MAPWLRSLSVVMSLATLLLGCKKTAPPVDNDAGMDATIDAAPDVCEALFGLPNENTGLDENQCRPICGCGAEEWIAPTWDEDRLDGLRAWTLLDPPAEFTEDPYASPTPEVDDDAVCAVLVEDIALHTYRLANFESAEAAEDADAIVTHSGVCGVCSTLEDLAVYAGTPELTTPVRDCGIMHGSDFEGDVTCLEDLGFTRPCAQIWAYNTSNTRATCLEPCFRLISAPHNEPDGDLNECLACDEVNSGPVFMAIAGRTRRNTGIPSSICRPCSEVLHLEHEYE